MAHAFRLTDKKPPENIGLLAHPLAGQLTDTGCFTALLVLMLLRPQNKEAVLCLLDFWCRVRS
jgi:hypothetical protein